MSKIRFNKSEIREIGNFMTSGIRVWYLGIMGWHPSRKAGQSTHTAHRVGPTYMGWKN